MNGKPWLAMDGRVSDNNSGEGQREEHLRAVEQLGTSLSIFSPQPPTQNGQGTHAAERGEPPPGATRVGAGARAKHQKQPVVL
jgi:hypothetical protein